MRVAMATPVSPNQSSFATRQSSVRNEATETVGAEVPVQRTKSGVTFPLDVDEPMDDECVLSSGRDLDF